MGGAAARPETIPTMNDYSADVVDTVRLDMIRILWEGLLRTDGLTVAGLRYLRGMLAPEAAMFLPSRAVVDLALGVDVALADKLGCPLADMPGRSGLDHPPVEWLS